MLKKGDAGVNGTVLNVSVMASDPFPYMIRDGVWASEDYILGRVNSSEGTVFRAKNVDHMSENIIEISWIYQNLKNKNALPDCEDSLEAKAAIIHLAKMFEEEYAGIDWNEVTDDYYEEIEKFASYHLRCMYGSSFLLDEQIETMRRLFKAYTDSKGYDFCDKDITELVDDYMNCQDWDGDVMLTGVSTDEMNDWIRHAPEVSILAHRNKTT